MFTTTYAERLLQEWLTNGLGSQYEHYLNTEIRTGKSFYTDIQAEQGTDAAEEALRKWDRARYRSNFAAGIEPVARGMLALARTDSEGQHTFVSKLPENTPFPRCSQIARPSTMVVLFNDRQAPGCGCNLVPDTDIFAPQGRLGLKAVTLQVGASYRSGTTTAQLNLVLPQRALDSQNLVDSAYTVVSITLDGSATSSTYAPTLSSNWFLRHALGLAGLNDAVRCTQMSGGHLDDAVGFPGATGYLAGALPKLGQYFTALAAKLSPAHTH